MKRKMLGFVTLALTMLVASTAFAQEGGSSGGNINFVAAYLGLGIAAFGGALGQGRVGAAALTGIARNPNAADRIQTPMIIALALIESLVIYALIIAFMVK